MDYQEFIDKVTSEVLDDEYIERNTKRGYSEIIIFYEGWILEISFEQKFFEIKTESYETFPNFFVGWNLYEFDYVNVVLHDEEKNDEHVTDNLSRDEFFNYSLEHECNVTYEQYLDLGNVFNKLKDLYV